MQSVRVYNCKYIYATVHNPQNIYLNILQDIMPNILTLFNIFRPFNMLIANPFPIESTYNKKNDDNNLI